MLTELPDTVDFERAATLPVAGLTARTALAKAPRTPERRVLITGASGGVGVFTIQLAALGGEHVSAAIRNPAHEGLLRRLGAADVVIGAALSGSGPFDHVIESVGGETLGVALTRLAPGGMCVLIGASAGELTTFDASKFRVGGTSLYGLIMQWEFQSEPPSVGLAELAGLLATKKLEAVIERRAPIGEIAGAAADLMARRFTGKAVLTWDKT
jgi:NADPH:quinone reductase-like Zn-dependent oxidoreductase